MATIIDYHRQGILRRLMELMADGRERTTGEIADRLSTPRHPVSSRYIGRELARLPQFQHSFLHSYHVWCLTEKPLEKKRNGKATELHP